MIAVIADVLVVLGLAILTVGVYGVVRMPDVYTQLHAASKAGFVGIAALLASAALRGDAATIARAALIVALLTLTTPVAAHATARAARRRGEPMRTPDAIDES
ncbi:MAG TPA: monovalent cation/H(+) antiporter subunit G [Solirubrobacteraceae bacterium]|nr:monovalent cation/H(+) antiporter subunit G [Solirubrobacteraceae bacterium]